MAKICGEKMTAFAKKCNRRQRFARDLIPATYEVCLTIGYLLANASAIDFLRGK